MALKIEPVTQGRNTGKWRATGNLMGVHVSRLLETEDKKVAEHLRVALEARLIDDVIALRKSASSVAAAKTFGDACDLYLRSRSVGRGPRMEVQRLERVWGDELLREIDPAFVLEWVDENQGHVTGATRRKTITMAQAVINHAAKQGWCNTISIERPEDSEHRTRWFTQEEFDEIIKRVPEFCWPAIMFMAMTGARPSEVRPLRWVDMFPSVHHAGGWEVELRNKKGNGKTRRRRVPLNPRAMEALREQARLNGQSSAKMRDRSGYVFRNMWGDKYQDTKSWRTRFVQAAEDAGVDDVVMHDLRRTFASWLVQRGHSLQMVADLLGHTSLVMVQRYAHLAPDAGRAAVLSL